MVRIIYDLGGPLTSDKAFVSCRLCGVGMFVLLKDILDFNVDEIVFPIHKECEVNLEVKK